MSKIRKGDQVVVLSGRDKGRQGQVLKVLASGHVLIENVNKQKKHQKPNQQANQPGGIIEKEMPIEASNLRLWNPDAKKGDRVGFKVIGTGATRKKVRVFKSSGEVVDR